MTPPPLGCIPRFPSSQIGVLDGLSHAHRCAVTPGTPHLVHGCPCGAAWCDRLPAAAAD